MDMNTKVTLSTPLYSTQGNRKTMTFEVNPANRKRLVIPTAKVEKRSKFKNFFSKPVEVEPVQVSGLTVDQMNIDRYRVYSSDFANLRRLISIQNQCWSLLDWDANYSHVVKKSFGCKGNNNFAIHFHNEYNDASDKLNQLIFTMNSLSEEELALMSDKIIAELELRMFIFDRIVRSINDVIRQGARQARSQAEDANHIRRVELEAAHSNVFTV